MTKQGYINGFLERKHGGRYEGILNIDGVDISPIEGVYFQEKGKQYLWLKRKPLLEYDFEAQTYNRRSREPRWETYMEKSMQQPIAYDGTCFFLRFKYRIFGIWDKVFGMERQRLNLFVERLPMSEQTIINGINERNKNNGKQ